MKKALIRYYQDNDTQVEAIVVETEDDITDEVLDNVVSSATLYRLVEDVNENGPVIINSGGGMCNLKHLWGDNSDFKIYTN
jgi:hypothetical protein